MTAGSKAALERHNSLFSDWEATLHYERPVAKSEDDLKTLSKARRAAYDRARGSFHWDHLHAETFASVELREAIKRTISDQLGPWRGKTMFFVEGEAHIGKSVILRALAVELWHAYFEPLGYDDDDGHAQHVPVAHVRFRGEPTALQLVRRLLQLYEWPGWASVRFDEAIDALEVVVRRHHTVAIIVDEVSFTPNSGPSGRKMSAHFKSLNNELPVTLIFGGITLQGRGWKDFGNAKDPDRAQITRRSRFFDVVRYDFTKEDQRRHFITFLNSLEDQLLLSRRRTSRLSAEFGVYIAGRTQGHHGAVKALLAGAAARAMADGSEAISLPHLAATTVATDITERRRADWERPTTRTEALRWCRLGRLVSDAEHHAARVSGSAQ